MSAHCYDAVAPAGTHVAVDRRIGICTVHAWWFGVDGQNVIACPEPGCRADIQLYERGEKVRYLSPAASGGAEPSAPAALHGKQRDEERS